MWTPAERLKIALGKLGKYNQSLIASELHYSTTQFSYILNEKRALTKRFAHIVNVEYGINEKWLLTGDGEMMSDNKPRFTAAENREPYQTNAIIENDAFKFEVLCKAQTVLASSHPAAIELSRIILDFALRVQHNKPLGTGTDPPLSINGGD